MCEPAKCEGCGATKRRPLMRPAPEGWLYIETLIDDAEPDGLIIWACSERCARSVWRAGPGPIMTEGAPLPIPEGEQ